ncbi:MAG: tRNA (adenosine(37)-N6)-threonylcarbamoyltransferase complex dimerization subunit type 1 TsaB [Thermodesulfovibrio sp.]|nr:tRNA (adenosine(37)-N6)-threonylcarbamoyltransferase complex dimerization subunit type 1 TsaB [Thermodesulfovibrio sp.]
MRILGIDTSTKYAGVAVLDDGNLIAQSIMQFKASHSEKLLPEIAHIFEIMKIPLETIDYYAITVGPGSFTGLRVGVSTIKGLAYVTGKYIIPVSSLEVIARRIVLVEKPICPILDARKKEVYTALFQWNEGKLIRIKKDSVLTIEKLAEWINEQTIFTGDGVSIYKEKISALFGTKAIFIDSIYRIPSPEIVATVAQEKLKEGFFISAKELEPIYLRKSEAEIKFE